MKISTINGIPAEQWNDHQAAWQAKMAIRLPVEQFDLRELVNTLLSQHWMHECEILPYKGKFAKDTEPTRLVVRFPFVDYNGENHWYLRHSAGPGTGTFWDIYGDDFIRPELALVELSKAYPPPCLGIIPTHGK